jgi:hypothetical protein
MLTRHLVAPAQAQPPKARLNLFCYKAITRPWFEPLILTVIVLNTLTLMLSYDGQGVIWRKALNTLNHIFSAIYVVEAALKILALRRRYFKDGWNIFDFIIVIFTLINVAVTAFASTLPINPSVLRVLRVLRVVRVLRLIKRAQGIRRLLLTLFLSGPALLNVASLLFLIIFIYAIVGMQLFGHVKPNGALDDFTNFRDFGSAFTLLFRLATAAGWNDVLEACSLQAPACDPEYRGLDNGNCGDPVTAKVFFSTFVFLTFLIIVNMYIAIILENLAGVTQEEELTVTDDDVESFYARWAQYDPLATQFVTHDDLLPLVAGLSRPLGIPGASFHDISKLNIPLFKDDRAHCLDVLHALVRTAIAEVAGEDTDDIFESGDAGVVRLAGRSTYERTSWDVGIILAGG